MILSVAYTVRNTRKRHYTTEITGVNHTTGIATVEIYEVP